MRHDVAAVGLRGAGQWAGPIPPNGDADIVDGLERFRTAMLLVSSKANIVFANGAARAMLERGAPLQARGDCLTTATVAITRQLHRLIDRVSEVTEGVRPVGGVLAVPQSGQFPFSVLVEPIPSRRECATPRVAAMVFIQDLNRGVGASEALRILFDLTSTEARIAEAIGNGHTIAAIALTQRASPQTIRKHLKLIFAKTGAHRQAQLAAIVHRCVCCVLQPVWHSSRSD